MFYLNGIPVPNGAGAVRAYEFTPHGLNVLVKTYSNCLVVVALLLPCSIWFGLVRKLLGKESALTIIVLTSVNTLTVITVLCFTVVLKTSTTFFDLARSRVAVRASNIFHGYYLLVFMNAALLMGGFSWGEGWYAPPEIVVLILIFIVVAVAAGYRLAMSLISHTRPPDA